MNVAVGWMKEVQRYDLGVEISIADMIFPMNIRGNTAPNCDRAVARMTWQIIPTFRKKLEQHPKRNSGFYLNLACRTVKIQNSVERLMANGASIFRKGRGAIR